MNKLLKGVQEYLTMQSQFGYKLLRTRSVLIGFAEYAKQKKVSHVTTKLALEYAMLNQNAEPASWASRLGIIRRFALHMRLLDQQTEVPPPHLLPYSYRRKSPFIYSENDILNILETCKTFPLHPLELKTYYTLFGLIAVTGLRPGEALNLESNSVDISLGIITIRDSKCRKTRKIPVHSTTIKALKEYMDYRDQYFKQKTSSCFFVNKNGKRLCAATVRNIFIKICIQAGLQKKSGCVGPRMMGLRHTFAIRTLVNCYKLGLNVDIVMPILSFYLGHENPTNTYWYLSATPELFSLINARIEKKFGGK